MEHLIYLISNSLHACRNISPHAPDPIDEFRNQSTLSPFDIPLIFEQILSYLDKVTVRSCQVVCKRWYEYAAPISWYRTIQDDSFNGHSPEHWSLLQINLHYVNALTWVLSANDKLREERILQFATALSRRRASMRTLTLQGSYNLENDLRAILPYIPQLRQLNLQTHWTQSFERNTLVSLEAIFENAAQLKTLQLGDNISLSFSHNNLSPTNGPTTSLSPRLNESLACRNARGLVSLDVVDVKLNAQQLLGLSEYFPNLQALKFDISPISISMDLYQNIKPVSAMNPPGSASNSQAFARDIAMSWPKLCDVSIRYNEDRFKSGSIEVARLHTRDIVAELAPRLSSLDIWSELLHHELLDSLAHRECTGTYYLPNDLKNSGFYQLASLKELRAISVCFFQDEDSLSGCKSQVFKDARTTVSNEDEVVGFLHRKDLKWMVEQWPSIKLLEFRGSFHSDDELKKAQHWVNEATGRSGKITLSDGRNSFIPSVRESLGLE
ncbi:hypothetical protein BGX21_000138 [Mortierella sp. AD011]|nr:hypothetical protein BGX21_000138 [Mortierella sp. AD011]